MPMKMIKELNHNFHLLIVAYYILIFSSNISMNSESVESASLFKKTAQKAEEEL